MLVCLSSLCCSTFLGQRPATCAFITSSTVCVLVAVIVLARCGVHDWEACEYNAQYWFAALVFYLTQIATRCALPATALLIGMRRWGVWLNSTRVSNFGTDKKLNSVEGERSSCEICAI